MRAVVDRLPSAKKSGLREQILFEKYGQRAVTIFQTLFEFFFFQNRQGFESGIKSESSLFENLVSSLEFFLLERFYKLPPHLSLILNKTGGT